MHTPFTLLVHDDAKADLEQLWKDAPRAAARIAVLLQELQGSQDLLDRLTQHGFGDRSHAKFHISRWLEYWRKGKNLWRLKDWNLENDGFRYRIIYTFVPSKMQYHILAIAPRDFNYVANHPITKRVLRACSDL